MRLAHRWTPWCLAALVFNTPFWAAAQNVPVPATAAAQAAPDPTDHSDRAATLNALDPAAPNRPLLHTPLPTSGGIAQDSVAWPDANAAVAASAQRAVHAVPAQASPSIDRNPPSHHHGSTGGQP